MQTQPTIDLAKTYGGREVGSVGTVGVDYFITADNEDRAISPPDLAKTKGGRDHQRF